MFLEMSGEEIAGCHPLVADSIVDNCLKSDPFVLHSLKLTFQCNDNARNLLIDLVLQFYEQEMKFMNWIKLMIIITCWKP